MKSNRDLCIKECLKWEGGYSNVAADPGGPTNWGITIIDARKYWKKDATAADVKAMPQSVAINIYTSKYWKTPYYDCDKLASGVDLAVFDFGVNSGPSRAKQYLDKSVGGTAEETVVKLCDLRLAFLQRLKTWPTFGTGWAKRVRGIKAKGIEMAKKPIITPGKTGLFAGIVAAFAAIGAIITDTYHWSIGHAPAILMTAGALFLIIWGLVALRNRNNRDV